MVVYHTMCNTQPYCHAALWITRKPKPTHERFSQFTAYSYVKSLHVDNDSCLPIYKMIPAICNTPCQTHCIRNSIFLHFVMVIACCGPSCGLWLCVARVNGSFFQMDSALRNIPSLRISILSPT